MVSAAEVDCSKYGCATCKYIINSYELIYTLKSDGSGAAFKQMEVKKIDANNRTIYDITDNLSASNFISLSENKLVCPSQIYVKFDGGASAKVDVKVFFEKKTGRRGFELSSSENNNKMVKANDKKTISCDYDATIATGSGIVKSTIISDGETILSQEYAGGYKPSEEDYPEIAKLFKDSNGTLICPSLYISCGSSGSNKFCKIYEENELTGNTNSGTESGNADNTENPSNNEVNVGFWGNLDVIQCGTVDVPAPIPPLVRLVVMAIKIVTPFVLIVMGMVDMLKAVIGSKDDEIKKEQQKFIKRVIAAVLLFFVVSILQFVIGFIAPEDTDSVLKCVDCLINDASKCN